MTDFYNGADFAECSKGHSAKSALFYLENRLIFSFLYAIISVTFIEWGEKMRDYFIGFMDEFGYPDEAKAVLLKTYDAMRGNKAMANVLDTAFFEYTENTIDWDKTAETVSNVAKEMDLNDDTVIMVYLLCMTKHTRILYQEKNLPYSLFKDTFKDFNYKLRECHDRTGAWGVCCYRAWFTWFFTLERFALGRLQYEIKPFRGREPYTKHGVTLIPEETPCLNFHIPSSGPLTPESVEDSFARAYEFYKDMHISGYIPIMTQSWLLFPEHLNMLSEKSNIVQFIKRFDLLFTDNFDGYGVPFTTIYNRTFNGDIDSYSPDNSLKRGYIELVKQNKPCGTTCGVTLYKPE